jgi:hypothetical protein
MGMTSPVTTPEHPQKIKHKYVRWAFYVVLLLVSVSLNHSDEIFGPGECDQISLTARFWYQRFSMVGYRKPRAHSVRLVILSSDKDPIFDKCEGREFMATLITRLAALSPSVVVIDKWYPSQFCPGIPSQRLTEAVTNLSKVVPVVISEDSNTEEELSNSNDPDLPRLKAAGLTDRDQILTENLFVANGKSVRYGLARSNCDNRRIPLLWPVFSSRSEVSVAKRRYEPSLPLAAAEAVDPDIDEIVGTLPKKLNHPFTSFLEEANFKPIHGIQIVCDRFLTSRDDWRKCVPPVRSEFGLRGKIVLIGERSADDQHQSVLGTVPGVVLQANYLESILDDRYFRPINQVLEVTMMIACFLIIEMLFDHSSLFKALLTSVAFVIFLWLISYVVILQWGYFLSFWFPASIAVGANCIGNMKDRLT